MANESRVEPAPQSRSEQPTTPSGGTTTGQAVRGALVGQPLAVQLSVLSPGARVQRDATTAPATPAANPLVTEINGVTAATTPDALGAIFRRIDGLSHAELVTTVQACGAHIGTLITRGRELTPNDTLTRIAVAAGASQRGQLARGSFGWVRSTIEADAVIAAIEAIGGGFAGGMNFLRQFDGDGSTAAIAGRASPASHSRVAAWLDGHPGPNREPGIKAWFDHAPNASLDVLRSATASYFGLRVGQFTEVQAGASWDAAGLRETWPVLETLPARDVNLVDLLGRVAATGRGVSGIGGRGDSGEMVASVGYTERSNIAGGVNNEGEMVQRGDPLYGRNRFDTTVRHEVGHVVAVQLGFAGMANAARFGGWQTFGGWEQAAEEMLRATGDITRGVLRGKTGLVDDMGVAIGNPAGWFLEQVVLALRNGNSDWGSDIPFELVFWDRLSADEQASIRRDPIFTAVRRSFNAWRHDDGGESFGDRKFNVDNHSRETFSYLAAARARKVSKYQMKAPTEWFAEVYATHYDPGGGPARLASRDPDARTWFDQNVHRR